MTPELEASQVALLVDLVEAARKALPERPTFTAWQAMGNDPRWFVNHPASSGYLVHSQDLIAFERADLLHINRHPSSVWEFFVLPAGYAYYPGLRGYSGATCLAESTAQATAEQRTADTGPKSGA